MRISDWSSDVCSSDLYSQLCRLITVARRAAEKGEYRLGRADVEREAFDNDATGLFALWLPGAEPEPGEGAWLRNVFGDRAHLAVELHREDDDSARLACQNGRAKVELQALMRNTECVFCVDKTK